MHRKSISRPYHEKYEPGQSEYDLFTNKNIDWINGKFTRIFYFLFVVAVWGVLHVSGLFPPGEPWTVTNVIHGVITFILFHWIKGNPDESTQGEYNGYTLYEQIDAGTPWTDTKKFLMLVPTVLTWMACHSANYQPVYLVVNLGIFLILIIAKIPLMHRVRLFGINSTLGIDTPTVSSKEH